MTRKVERENQIFALKFRNLLFKDNVHDFRRAVLMDASHTKNFENITTSSIKRDV